MQRFFSPTIQTDEKKEQHNTFIKEFKNILRTNDIFKKAFSEKIKHIFQIQQTSNRMVKADHIEADYNTAAKKISQLYYDAIKELNIMNPISLQDIIKINVLFIEKYNHYANVIYKSYGFYTEALDEKFIERTKKIAYIKFLYFKNHNSPIIIHILGNNSREGTTTAMIEYEEIIRLAQEDKYLLERILQHIFIVHSSAGGKATEINLVDGIAIPELAETIEIKVDKNNVLLPANYLIHKNKKISLQQFGAPDAIQVIIKHKNNMVISDIYIYNEDEKKEFLINIPVRLASAGLFFGLSEAEINEAEFKAILNRKKLPHPNFILEKDSFNTGENCRLSKRIIENEFSERGIAIENSTVTYIQKQQQGIRASTTAALQGQSFKLFFYNNPDFSSYINFMPTDQLLVYSMNLLKELLTEQKYVLSKKYFHHPLPLKQDCLLIALEVIRYIFNWYYKVNLSLEEISFDNALLLFNLKIWPQIEKELTRHKDENRKKRFLITYLTPILAKKAKNSSPDEVQSAIEQHLSLKK